MNALQRSARSVAWYGIEVYVGNSLLGGCQAPTFNVVPSPLSVLLAAIKDLKVSELSEEVF